MRSLPDQLREAWKSSKLTLEQLIDKAGLEASVPSLSRKLRGEQPMTTAESQAIANALGATIVWVGENGEAA